MFAGVTAYIEPVAVGDSLPEMPLYVATDGYVLVPLQPTYDRAFAALPPRWANVLEQCDRQNAARWELVNKKSCVRLSPFQRLSAESRSVAGPNSTR